MSKVKFLHLTKYPAMRTHSLLN